MKRLALLLALLLVLRAREAQACAACGCGDPTLVAAGTEQPFAGRLRVSSEWRYRTDVVGEPGVDRIEIEELRGELSVAWAPLRELFLVAAFPLVHRSIVDASLAETSTWGPGDAELRAKLFLYRDRDLAPRSLLAGLFGLKFPTAPFRRNELGERLPLEAQSGTGSLDLLAGASYAAFSGDFSAYASAQVALPLLTREDVNPGVALRSTLAAQYQLTPWLALRPAVDVRADRASEEEGTRDPNSGGVVLFAGGDLLTTPLLDLTVSVGARAPLVQELHGFHDEGPVWSAAVAYDL
ncbi:MAG: transporter [Myxococcota bacterium]|jgi:hypothetical protein|nr:transporter [Myxococcota bacterium]